MGQKIPSLGVFGVEFKKTILIFEVSAIKFVKFCEKIKLTKFGTKNAISGYFLGKIFKNYGHIWNQHPESCLSANCRKKAKMPKFGFQNHLFGYF